MLLPPAPATLVICWGCFPAGIPPVPAPGLQLLSLDFPLAHPGLGQSHCPLSSGTLELIF